MSDLKAYVAGYKACLHKFVPHLPKDGDDLDYQRSLQHNLSGLSTLLKSNILIFLCEVVSNSTLAQFVHTFLLSAPKASELSTHSNESKIAQKVCLLILRTLSSPDADELITLLPSPTVSVSNKKGDAADGMANSASSNAKRQLALAEQFRAIAASVPFARVPDVMEIMGIIGDGNGSIGNQLLHGVCGARPTAQKELADCIGEAIKALAQVHSSVIVLSRRVQDHRQPRTSGPKPSSTKVSGLSVLSLERRSTGTAEKSSSKMTSAAELMFLCDFAVDIVLTLCATLEAALCLPALPWKATNILCLEGTHLTGIQGLPLLRIIQNVYEVQLPLLARTAALERAEVDVSKVRSALWLLQGKCLQILHDQLSASVRALNTLRTKSGEKSATGAYFDSMDVLAEDGVEWMSFFNGYDPLGRDPLTLCASAANAGETASNKVLISGTSGGGAAGGVAQQSRSTVTAAGVVHTVEESEVVRGALLADYMRVYGSDNVEAIVRQSLGDGADEERVNYVVTSLRVNESLLEVPKPTVSPSAAALSTTSGRSDANKVAPSAASATAANAAVNSENVANIKALFPDLGEGFIEACLIAYQGNMEEIVDALLTNNLQPKLLVLDRGLQKVWVGKGGSSVTGTASLDAKARDARTVYQSVEDEKFKKLQRERLRKMEAQQEFDHMLLSREYNDDYDDQYDDVVVDPLKVQVYGGGNQQETDRADSKQQAASSAPKLAPQPAPAPVILNRRDRRRLKAQGEMADASGVPNATAVLPPLPPAAPLPTAVVHQQMAEMKRLNTLTREAEAEAAYWESMRNTNRHSGAHSGKGSWKADLLRQQQEEEAQLHAQQQGGVLAQGQGQGAVNTVKAGAASAGKPGGGAKGPAQGSAPAQGTQEEGGSGRPQQTQLPQSRPSQPKGSAEGGGGGKKSDNKTDPKGPNKNTNKGDDGSSTAGSEGQQKKHRTKPYDKHHQKDRSTRKTAHFMPAT